MIMTPTTTEVANRLVELCRIGDYDSCYSELYDENIISIEMPDTPHEKRDEGMKAIRAKGKKRHEMMEKFISWWVGDPLVAGDYFTLTMGFTCIYKGQTHESHEEEVCVYHVKNGKIAKEMFFYTTE